MIILLDNGSKRPSAVFALRALAARLAERLQCPVEPVSLAHADGIAAADLEGLAAKVFSEFVVHAVAEGQRNFTVIPLFFGRSGALTSVLTQKIEALQTAFGDCHFKVAETLVPLPRGEPRMASILYDQLSVLERDWADGEIGTDSYVVLTDHGTPSVAVNDVRRWLASALERQLLPRYSLLQAVMERREGSQYDFNGETLQQVLAGLSALHQPIKVIVAMLFLLPGRHAGVGGDIDAICHAAAADYPLLDIRVTPLIAEHPLLIDILEARYLAVLP